MSADAINLAKKVVITKDEENNIPETMIYEWVGVTDINVEPYCEFEKVKHWHDILETSKINKIYWMDDNCCIIQEESKIEILGNYRILNDGKVEFSNLANKI